MRETTRLRLPTMVSEYTGMGLKIHTLKSSVSTDVGVRDVADVQLGSML